MYVFSPHATSLLAFFLACFHRDKVLDLNALKAHSRPLQRWYEGGVRVSQGGVKRGSLPSYARWCIQR
uniref:Uncharacterized protein n=1 Tax=Picea glauca TaxID=3330 RepID=A0A101M1L6_PICGL|nr:hypothetical protein ABT39_MTgene3930 [Picea glauca]